MANLTESPVWDGVYEIAEGDILGPLPSGVSNNPHQALLNRLAYLRSRANEVVPLGTVHVFTDKVLPDGYLACNGSFVSKTTYAELYSVIGDLYGTSGGSFRLPDYRGMFLRHIDGFTGRNPEWSGLGMPVFMEIADWDIVEGASATADIDLYDPNEIARIDWLYTHSGLYNGTDRLILTDLSGNLIYDEPVDDWEVFGGGDSAFFGVNALWSDSYTSANSILTLRVHAVGAVQDSEVKSHVHLMDQNQVEGWVPPYTNGLDPISGSSPTGHVNDPTGATGGRETRPLNSSVVYGIRYREI